ncbi:MAG: hypothetical protein FWB76_07370 [Oscillospiraceae bacterium]|nr:hypothetical protein [Oscillospiraceae bacterium]
MAKKVLAIFLATLMLATVFGVAATATNYDEVYASAEIDALQANIGFAFNAPSRSIVRRIERYMAIAQASTNLAMRRSVNAYLADMNSALMEMFVSNGLRSNRVGANIISSVIAVSIARELRAAGEMSWFASLWSAIRGHFWWLWVPVTGVIALVGGITLWSVLR